METAKTIALRRSTRVFNPEQIKEEALNQILDSGKLAPIARGQVESVWLTVVQNQELLDKMSKIAQESYKMPKMTVNHHAPTLIIVSGPESQGIEIANAACIVENMMLTATDLGLGSCYMMGPIWALKEHKEIHAELGIPEGFYPVSAIAVGYPKKVIEGEKSPRQISMNIIR